MRLINRLIQKLGKAGYKLDDGISKSDITKIMMSKTIQLLRGFIIRWRFEKVEGLLFVGANCKLKFTNKVILGKTVTIEDNVEINALSKYGVVIGNNVTIRKNTIIECTGVIRNIGEGLVVKDNVGISQNCFLQIRGKVHIGSNVIFGPNVSIFSENHRFSDTAKNIHEQGEIRKGVTIEDNVWVGSGSIILDGVTVGEGSIIAAGSVVNRDVRPMSIVGGIPAKLIKLRH